MKKLIMLMLILIFGMILGFSENVDSLRLNATTILGDTYKENNDSINNDSIELPANANTRIWIKHNLSDVISNFSINEFKITEAFINLTLLSITSGTSVMLFNSTNITWLEFKFNRTNEPVSTIISPFISKTGLDTPPHNIGTNFTMNIRPIVGSAFTSNQSIVTFVLNQTDNAETFSIASKEHPNIDIRPRFHYTVVLKPNITAISSFNGIFYRNSTDLNFTANFTNGDSSNITMRVFIDSVKSNETNFTNFIQNVSTSIIFALINKSQNITVQANISDAFANTLEKNTSILVSNIPPAITNVSLPASVTTDDLNVNGSVQLIWDDDNTGSFTEKLNITLTLFTIDANNSITTNSTTFTNYLNSSSVSFIFSKNWVVNDNLILQTLVTDGTDTRAVNSSTKQVTQAQQGGGGTAAGGSSGISLVPVLPPEQCPVKVVDDITNTRKLEVTYFGGISRTRNIRIESNKTTSDTVFLSCKLGCNLFNLTKNVISLNATSKYLLETTFVFPDNLSAETVNAVINYENVQKTCIGTLEYTFRNNFLANFVKTIKIPLGFFKEGLQLETFAAIIYFFSSITIALITRYIILRFTAKTFPLRTTATGTAFILFFVLFLLQIILI